MNRNQISKYIYRFAACILLSLTAGCTNLDEVLYDRITSENFLQTRDDVTRDFLRAFEHSYWSIQGGNTFMLQENSSDEMMKPVSSGSSGRSETAAGAPPRRSRAAQRSKP